MLDESTTSGYAGTGFEATKLGVPNASSEGIPAGDITRAVALRVTSHNRIALAAWIVSLGAVLDRSEMMLPVPNVSTLLRVSSDMKSPMCGLTIELTSFGCSLRLDAGVGTVTSTRPYPHRPNSGQQESSQRVQRRS